MVHVPDKFQGNTAMRFRIEITLRLLWDYYEIRIEITFSFHVFFFAFYDISNIFPFRGGGGWGVGGGGGGVALLFYKFVGKVLFVII